MRNKAKERLHSFTSRIKVIRVKYQRMFCLANTQRAQGVLVKVFGNSREAKQGGAVDRVQCMMHISHILLRIILSRGDVCALKVIVGCDERSRSFRAVFFRK